MVELLVVLVILALLVALLLPAMQGAMRTAREGAVMAEINTIGQALSQFNTDFGSYPPSRIVVNENGDYSSTTGLETRTLAAFRKYWPRAVFSTSGTPVFSATQIANGTFYDINGNGTCDATYILTGPQCLAFFLGGIPQVTNNGGVMGFGMTGFAKNPTNPFLNSTMISNRTTPYFEFNNNRLISDPNNAAAAFPGYIDSLGSYDNTAPPFYAYFSAYAGSGYDPNDYDRSELDSNSTQMFGAFQTNNFIGTPAHTPNYVKSAPPNPYVNEVPVPTDVNGALDVDPNTKKRSRTWQNPNSFQIIAPGQDRLYGIGGQYIPSPKGNAVALPWVASGGPNTFQTIQANADVTGVTLAPDARSSENDNLSNFATGRLQ